MSEKSQPSSLLEQATASDDPKEALRLAGEAVSRELLVAMKAAGITKAEKSVQALDAAGLNQLLAIALAKGKLSYRAVDDVLVQLREALSNRTLTAEQIKDSILSFDAAAQRLAMVGGHGGGFEYPTKGNRARDSLMTFARSLHR